jgi:uncharacterized membrane protein YhaH (DUF805 family)
VRHATRAILLLNQNDLPVSIRRNPSQIQVPRFVGAAPGLGSKAPSKTLKLHQNMIAGVFVFVLWLAIAVFYIACGWKIFTKAGQPGWACIIPFYNIWVMLKIVNRPGWWLLLMLIPFVSIVFGIIVVVDLAKAFGKSVGFAIFMILLGFIAYPMLAFGSAQYTRPVRAAA